ncbi:MAG: hypothetical protein SVG88_01515 [Halobacteriales archaeon]|nr:hypothetical protein [Halobacteriales archaeon]
MPPIPERAFRKCLRQLDRTTFVAFVCELWQARGYTVDRDDPAGVLTVSDGTDCQRLWVHHESRLFFEEPSPPSVAVDVVVSNRQGGPSRLPPGTPDPDVIGPAQLRELALYAIDRDRRQQLFDRFLGRSPVVPPAEPTDRPHIRTVATVALIGVLIVAFVGGGWTQGGFAAITDGRSGVGGVDTVDPTTFREPEQPMSTTTPSDDTPTATPVVDSDADLPDGLARTGIVDARELAQRHAQLITGQSYTLELIYREIDTQRVGGSIRETVHVQRPTVYASRISALETPAREPPIIAETAAYANGTVRTTRDAPNETRPADHLPGGEGRYADRVEAYLERYLTVESSAIVDRERRENVSYYWVRLGDNPAATMENAFGRALIDERGIVHYLSVTYDVPDTTMQVVIAIHYTQIGGVLVVPPDWVVAANQSGTVTDGCHQTNCSDTVSHPVSELHYVQ